VNRRAPETHLLVCTGNSRSREARALVRVMEAEFLAGKGRRGGLARFYPDVFASREMGRLYGLVEARGKVVAALGARLVRIRSDGRRRSAAMIGFVVTVPSHRGCGLGQRLMTMTAEHLREAGIDYGVLWTRRLDLYRKCGWQLADPSLIGRWQGDGVPTIDATWSKAPFAPALRGRLNRLRPQPALERPVLIYDKLPYPAERLWTATVPGAYLLIGEKGDEAQALEWGGNPDRVTGLMTAAARRWPGLTLRGSTSDPLSRRLARSGLVSFEAEPAAMWISLAHPFRRRDGIWIPRLDRI